MFLPLATFLMRTAAAVLLALPALAFGPQFVVTTTNDSVDVNIGDGICADAGGQCSLRAAVQEANASGAASTIQLQAGATYALTSMGAGENAAATGDLDVTGQIDLIGNGASIDASSADRAFDVITPGSLRVTNALIRNGSVVAESGGAFRSNSTLELRDAIILASHATGAGASGGGVFNDGGSLILVDCRISGCSAERAGGGIEANAGTTSITTSTLGSNSTGPAPGNGGAFHLTGGGTVTIVKSAFPRNVAAREGGALWNSSTGVMTVTGSRMLGNSALGAAADDGGGGVFNDGGMLTITGSVIAKNTASVGSGSGGGVFNNGGTVAIALTRIADNRSNRAGGGIEALAGTTNLFNSELSGNTTGASPGNGGGLHLTGTGSVSVDATDVLNNTATAEGGGLWNSVTGTMTVANCLISDNSAGGNDPDQGGGGLFNDGGDLTITNSVVSRNAATGTAGSGGGALNVNGDLIVRGTRFEANSATRAGGAIEANAGTTDLDDAVLIGNACGPAPGNGGGLHLTGAGGVTVDDSVVRENFASAEGGGLWNSAVGTMTITGSDIQRNVASGNGADQGGGGVFNDGGTLNIVGGVISENVANGTSGSGGGVLNDRGLLSVSTTTISGNSARRAGGGIEANIGTTLLSRVRLDRNSTGPMPGNGGGLHLTGAGMVGVDMSSVTRNSAANEGGGLWNSTTGTMTVTSSRINDNTAPVGSEVFNDGGTFTVDGAPIPVGP